MAWINEFVDLKQLLLSWLPRRIPRLADLRFSNVHDDGLREGAAITSDLRYPPPASYPAGATNAHGEIERLGEVEATHWYAEASGVTWHFVTTGSPDREPLLLLHGLPESWFAFHNQMRDLSDRFYCVGVDIIGNGQSDKRLCLDYSYPAIAAALAKFIDAIGLETFNLGGHDRGAVVADHLLNTADMQRRVLRYVRMQQSADQPHGDPLPPHRLFASFLAVYFMKWRSFPDILYSVSMYRVPGISREVLRRLDYEFKFPGVARAVVRQFRTTSFAQELRDRHDALFARMTMPVLFLQGRFDPGQHPEEYADTPSFVADGRVQFIDANHFFHLEAPDQTTAAMRAFLNDSR